MNDVYIKFKGTEREGTIPVGSYLSKAASRLGVDLGCECDDPESEEVCVVKVVKGTPLLSKPTAFEIEHLSARDRKDRHRLACQTRIEKPGEIELMTVNKEAKSDEKQKEKETDRTEEFKKEFRELPLGEKISSLVELEMMALGDTISYVLNSPYDAVGKVMDVMAGFGRDMEDREREAAKPKEHAEEEKKETDSSKNGKSKKTTTRRRTRKTTAKKSTTAKRTRRKRKPAKKDEEDKS
ncbi:MAG: 2Fe-2S iron-sulfur cluster binding domain-containing protein [Pyrinomonadaceae bacterium]|nr:2Fe-2S iron-sulfur cluster binding domain-containing protein [Pyrinomonadaceae bacterium]